MKGVAPELKCIRERKSKISLVTSEKLFKSEHLADKLEMKVSKGVDKCFVKYQFEAIVQPTTGERAIFLK